MKTEDLELLSNLAKSLREDLDLEETFTRVQFGPKLKVKQLTPEPDPKQQDVMELGRLAKHSYRVPLGQKEKPQGIKAVTKPSIPDPEGKGILSLGMEYGMRKKK